MIGIRKYGNIAFLLIYLFAIFRYDIGSDYHAYWQMVTVGSDKTRELLSGFIIDFVSYVEFPPLIFIIFSTISLLSYKTVIDKYSSLRALSWYFYFSFPVLFLQDCSTIRNSAAMAFFFLAFVFADKGEYLKAVVCMAISPLFHDTGYISFGFLFLPLVKRIDLKLNILFFVASFFAGSLVEKLVVSYLAGLGVGDHFMRYVSAESGGLNSLQIVFYFINISNLLFYKKLTKGYPSNALMITLANFGMCLYNILRIEPISAIRFYCYFIFFEAILIPYYRNIFARFVSSKSFANLVLVILMFSLQLMMVIRYISVNNSDLAPYRVWLNYI